MQVSFFLNAVRCQNSNAPVSWLVSLDSLIRKHMESKKWLDMSWWDGRGLCLLVASSSAPLPATPTHLLIPLCTFPHAMHRRLFPSPDLYNVSSSVSHSVVSDSLRSHRLYPARFLCLWDSPGKNTGVDCHSLLQRIFPTQGSNPDRLHCRQILYCLSYREDIQC